MPEPGKAEGTWDYFSEKRQLQKTFHSSNSLLSLRAIKHPFLDTPGAVILSLTSASKFFIAGCIALQLTHQPWWLLHCNLSSSWSLTRLSCRTDTTFIVSINRAGGGDIPHLFSPS